MKKILLVLFVIILSTLFVSKVDAKQVLPDYPVLEKTIWDWSVQDYDKENNKENKQQISDEFIRVMTDEENALTQYLNDEKVSDANKNKAFLKHMNNVFCASLKLAQVVDWIIYNNEGLPVPSNNKTIIKSLYGIKYRFQAASIEDEGESFLSYMGTPVRLVDYPMVIMEFGYGGGTEFHPFPSIDSNYYINKYKGKISNETIEIYKNGETFENLNFNEESIVGNFLHGIMILLLFLLIAGIAFFTSKTKWYNNRINDIKVRFIKMNLFYKIVLGISLIVFISTCIFFVCKANISYKLYLLISSLVFYYLLLARGFILRFLVAFCFAYTTLLLFLYQNIIDALKSVDVITSLIISIIMYIIYSIFGILMKFILKRMPLDKIKGFFTKKVIIVIVSVIILSGVIIFIKSQQLPTCDSKYAEETVISIFRQNDKIYQPNMDNVETITMSNFKPISYDKGINKYSCSANLTMHSKPDRAIFFVVPYNSFTYNVEYDIYKERGENKVSASWEMQNIWTQDIRR